MKRRNCAVVIQQMLSLIPEDQTDLISDLNWNMDDSLYKAPEESIQWVRTMETLYKHIPKPTEPWHFGILSIFTTKSIAELKELVNDNERSN